jgi:hypothetical protein
MQTWQIVALIWAAGALALVLPGLRSRAPGTPMLRWALIWLVALLGLMLAYEALLALGVDLTPARRRG